MAGRKIFFVLALLAVLAGFMVPNGKFAFVVIGDTRPRFESENFRIFEGLIPKINALKPAFAINLGDMIYGYGVLSKEKQWDAYQKVVKAMGITYYQIPGNHDVFSKEAREIYGRRFGKFYESFDYGGCHFVLLDNCEDGRWGEMGSAQIEWLRADLKHNLLGRVFVFLHFPLWEPERIAPRYYEFWKQILHPLFKESRVRAVFGGHYHAYGPTREFDGIPYFVTGGGGAELRPEYKKAGGVFHFLRVTVTGDSFEIKVITEQSELTDAEADVMGGLLFAERHASWIGLGQARESAGAELKISISLVNPYLFYLTGTAQWALDRGAFEVSPEKITLRLAPGEKTSFPFTVRALQTRVDLQSLPRLEFNVTAGGRRHRFNREILFLQQLKIPFLESAPLLDGKIDEWKGMPALDLEESGEPGYQIRAAYDPKNIYLAVNLPARPKPSDSAAFFTDDIQFGIADRIHETEFGADRLRWGISPGQGSSIIATERTPGPKTAPAGPGIKGACRDEKGSRVYEIAIPAAWLEVPKQGLESRLILNLAYRIPEEEAKTKIPGEVHPNSFSYQVRFGGGDRLTPVHFIELLLGHKTPF